MRKVVGIFLAIALCVVVMTPAVSYATECPTLDKWKYEHIRSYRQWYADQVAECTMYDEEYEEAEAEQDAATDKKIEDVKEAETRTNFIILFISLLASGL